jgi:hypothetical protein
MKQQFLLHMKANMAIISILGLATVAMAFIAPEGLPTMTFEGKVLSTEKVGDFTGMEPKEWELRKIEVIKFHLNSDSNITNKVIVYYDCPKNSTNLFDTNQTYSFACIEHVNTKSWFNVGSETNGLLASLPFTKKISK